MTRVTVPPPQMLPLGTSQPPGDKHAISTSLPTWDSVPGRALGYKWVTDKLQSNYPRFGINTIVQKLASAVLTRLNISAKENENEKDCLVFPSEDAARRCISYIQGHYEGTDVQADMAEFRLPLSNRWARFFAVVYDAEAKKEGAHFWSMFGDGLGSRHAEFCLSVWEDMAAHSNTAGGTLCRCCECAGLDTGFGVGNGNGNTHTAGEEQDCQVKRELKTRVARLVASENPSLTPPTESDVFLYPKGMCAIFAVSRALLPTDELEASEAVIFGWPYAETPKCVSNTGYARFTLYNQGSTSELDDLESRIASGSRICVLFCEVPSNPLLRTPDLHRIRDLAEKYNFVVVCDETLGTFINIDILPYVDIAITSPMKIFNGAGNAMGGSVVVNPESRHYEILHTNLAARYEDFLFPSEAAILAQNFRDIESRIHRCNANALAVSTFLSTQPCIKKVLYPYHSETRPLYERYRRQDGPGGYGYVLSIVFAEPEMAIRFYNVLNLRKGPTVGTNFSLALPYAWLAHVFDMEWAESQGIPRHIVRISVGLEGEGDLVRCVGKALEDLVPAARGN
ncbi:pyridoxal phosphate-dependent transferase [Aspergillus stella-maris]|uniref:pyridoxal phosphate-dependent transferase n=1 Tax=Aspergillus stella-maris TaxID=1810926 RepID=UPI003CCD0FA1